MTVFRVSPISRRFYQVSEFCFSYFWFFLIGWIKRCWKKRKRAGVGTLLLFPTLFYSYIGFLSIYVNGSLTFCEVLFIVLSLLRFRFLVSLCQCLYMKIGWYKSAFRANICAKNRFIYAVDLCAGFLRLCVLCFGFDVVCWSLIYAWMLLRADFFAGRGCCVFVDWVFALVRAVRVWWQFCDTFVTVCVFESP